MKSRRKLNRKLLSLLPETLRLELIRRTARVDSQWPSPLLEIKIADADDELESAYRLLHDSYVKAGYMTPDPTGMRVLMQHHVPQTATIVAKWDGRVIGTLSLIRDNPYGLPMEKIFNLDEFRRDGKNIAEVSSLAIDPAYRGQINHALFPLFRFVYQYAWHCFEINEFVIAVNPSMVDLYLAFMCFEKIRAKTQDYEFVEGAPAVGMHLNLDTAPKRWQKAFAHRPVASNFHKYWTEIPSDSRNQLPEPRRYEAPKPMTISPELTEEALGSTVS